MSPLPSRREAFRALALAALLCCACRGPSRAAPAFTPVEQAEAAGAAGRVASAATLGPGDVLEVRVYQEPDLSGPFRVSPEGTLDYPFCGRLSVNGLSASMLVDLLTGCLKPGYLKKPQVTVFLKEANSKKVFVFGEVQKPGTFPFEENMTVVQAMTLAGGFTKLAAKNSVIVTRVVNGEEKKYQVPVENIGEGRERNFALLPGDIVYVPESFL